MNSDTYSNGSYPSRYKVGERPTSSALLLTLLSHTLPILMIQVGGVPLLLLLQNVLFLVRGRGGSFYSLPGRFPPSLSMETLATALRKRRGYSTSKCTWTGTRLGSAKPRVRSTPGGAPLALPSSGSLTCRL
jgi:hypothetical protein